MPTCGGSHRWCSSEGCRKTLTRLRDAQDYAKLAQAADIAVVFVATTSSEGTDRRSLNLQDNGNALVSAVVAANPHTVRARLLSMLQLSASERHWRTLRPF